MPIGNYTKPTAPAPAAAPERSMVPTPKKESPASTVAKAVEKGLSTDVQAGAETVAKVLSYEDVLAAAKITREQAYEILDAMMSQDFYEERVAVTSRAQVTLRTRIMRDISRYHERLEQYVPRYNSERDLLQLRYNLAASLASFRDRTFDFPDPHKSTVTELDAAFEQRLEYVEGLPDVVVRRLCHELHYFDRRVFAALHEGATDFF